MISSLPLAIIRSKKASSLSSSSKALMVWTWGAALVVGAVGCGDKPAAKAAPPPREIDVVRLVPSEVPA